jgi:cystinosin
VADLAFSLHALVISSITLLQVFYYAYRNRNHTEIDNVSERTRLIPLPHELQGTSKSTAPSSSTRPSIPCQIAITGIVVAGIISGASVWAGRTEWLDWLYFASSVKLFVTLVKYVPQVILNTHLRSVEGFAIENILLVSDRESSHTPLAAGLEHD